MEPISISLFLFGVLGLVFYLYLIWNFDHWKKRGIVGPKPTPLIGNFPNAVKQSKYMVEDLDKIYREYKGKERFVGIFLTRNPQILVIDRELVRDVLITNFKNFHVNESAKWIDDNIDPIFARNPFVLNGEKWKQKRAEITPALTTNKLKVMFPVMVDICSKMNRYLNEESKETISAKDLASKFTSEVVSSCIYGIEAGSFTRSSCLIRDMGKGVWRKTLSAVFFVFNLFPGFRKFYKRPFISKEAETFFTNLLNDSIKMRLQSKIDRADFLKYMINLQEKKNLSQIDMAAHSLTFFLDGFETTSVLITRSLHMLAHHKHIQDRLRRELNGIADEDGNISYEQLTELSYLDQCLNETLRLFTPLLSSSVLLFADKVCMEDTEFKNSNNQDIKIKQGDVIQIPVFSIHHDEEYYPNPFKFNPDRFDPAFGGIKKFKDMGVFLPFLDGPRICLGMRFGLMQAKACVAGVLQNWEISVNPHTKNSFTFTHKGLLGGVEGSIWLDFKKLEKCS